MALEPAAAMLKHRRHDAAPAIQGRAEHLPFRDDAFDAVLAVLTLHHWADPALGLRECTRVVRDRIVLLTWDPDASGFWLGQDYLPDFVELDRQQFPTLRQIRQHLGGHARLEISPLPIPKDCHDGFLGAYWARPYCYLDARVRAGISSFARVPAEDGLARLKADLESGAWAARYSWLLDCEALDIGYRIAVAEFVT